MPLPFFVSDPPGSPQDGDRRQRWAARLNDVWALLFVLTAVIAAFGNVLGDPWRAVQEDTAVQWHGLFAAADEQIQQGRFPHWNPYSLGGERLFANAALGLFYPGSVLFRLLPFPTAVVWTWLFHYGLTALAVYALARAVLRVLRLAAVVAALGFSLGGFALGHANHLNFVMGMPYLPLVLLAVFRCHTQTSRSRMAGWWFVGTLSLTCMILSGGIPILFLTLVAMAWFVGVLAWRAAARRTYRGALVAVVISISMGLAALGLAACQVLPTLDLYLVSARGDYGEVGAATGAMPWQTLACQLLAPGVLAEPTIAKELWANHESYFFVGGVLMTFAMAGLLSFRRRPWVPALAVLLALSIALALGWPPLLRLMDMITPAVRARIASRYVGLAHLAVVLLAAVGIDAWLRASVRTAPVAVIGIVFSLIMSVAYFAITRCSEAAAVHQDPSAVLPVAVWSVAGLVVALAVLLLRLRRRSAAMALVCAWSVFELVVWSGRTWVGQGRSPAAPEHPTPVISFLRENLGDYRYYNAAGYPPLLANRGAVYGLENVEGYIASKLNETRERQAFRLRLRDQPQALNLFSAKYILIAEGQPTGPFMPVFRGDGVVVCENKGAMERCFFLGGVRGVSGVREALNIMCNAAFDPRSTGLLSDAEQMEGRDYPPLKEGETCSVTRWEPGRIEIDARCDVERRLFIGTSFDSGWSARLEGRPVRLDRTDVCFMSTEVPAGRHSIRLSYATPGLYAGVVVSVLTAIGLISVVCAQCFRAAAGKDRSRGLP